MLPKNPQYEHELAGTVVFASFLSTVEVLAFLVCNQIDFEIGLGRYEGVDEVCYVVSEADFYQYVSANPILSGQKSILFVERGGRAFLEYLDGSGHTEFIGVMHPAYPPGVFLTDFTYLPSINKFYTAHLPKI